MSQKKPFKEVSTEELLNYIDDAQLSNVEVEYTNTDNIATFVAKYGLVPGDSPLKQYLAYKLYKSGTDKPMAPSDFHGMLRFYLPSKNSNYYIDNKSHKINLIALESLIRDKQERSTTPKDYTKFSKFVDQIQLKSGPYKFSLDFLYNTYKVTMKIKKSSLTKYKMSYLLSKSFKSATKRTRWFYTNNFIKNMSYTDRKEILKLLRDGTEKTNPQRKAEIRWLEQKSKS